jgi:hypothetical protein
MRPFKICNGGDADPTDKALSRRAPLCVCTMSSKHVDDRRELEATSKLQVSSCGWISPVCATLTTVGTEQPPAKTKRRDSNDSKVRLAADHH